MQPQDIRALVGICLYVCQCERSALGKSMIMSMASCCCCCCFPLGDSLACHCLSWLSVLFCFVLLLFGSMHCPCHFRTGAANVCLSPECFSVFSGQNRSSDCSYKGLVFASHCLNPYCWWMQARWSWWCDTHPGCLKRWKLVLKNSESLASDWVPSSIKIDILQDHSVSLILLPRSEKMSSLVWRSVACSE